MPKSRNRRKAKSKKARTDHDRRPRFTMLSPEDPQHEELKSTLMDAARQRVLGLDASFSAIQQIFRDRHPEGVLSTIACYGLQRGMSLDGLQSRPASALDQHHIELLQAIMLTVPKEEWGWKPSVPSVIQQIWDDLPPLAEAFLAQRILAAEDVSDRQEHIVRSLQERIRLHTQAVRNWAYYGDVISISRQLFGPLDKQFTERLGFAASDLVCVAQSMVAEFEQRMNVHFNALRRVLLGKTLRGMARSYYKEFPSLQGSAEDMIRLFPRGATAQNMMAAIMAHMDLRLPELVTFRPDDLTERSGLSAERILAVLGALAMEPGQLANAKPEHLFLANPVWPAPAIKLDKGFLVPVPQSIFSHIHAIMHRLAEEAGATTIHERARVTYLEDTLVKILEDALPGASVRRNVKWKLGEQQFETDALSVLDRVVVIAEAKAHRLTPQGLRGAPDRVKRHIQDLIVDPAVQSQRLARLIDDARAGDAAASAILQPLGIDARKADHVIRVSVSLDDFSVLSSAEGDLREAGWVGADVDLAPVINVADLKVIAEILDGPIEFLHYLIERTPLQRDFDLLGDEIDFLGLYLETGFAISPLPENTRFAPSGMSEGVDRYYDARDAGIAIPKPRMPLAPYFKSILDGLTHQRPEGWTSVGLHLLGACGPDEQKDVVRRLSKLRDEVRRRSSKQRCGAALTIVPVAQRKACLAFYVHSHADRLTLKRGMDAAVEQALKGSSVPACLVVARHIDQWERPYQAIALIARPLASPGS